jgi:hypothetical protein
MAATLPAAELLDHLTLRIETPADAWSLRLGGILPEDILDGIDAGDRDLRHLVMYDAPARQLSIRTFIAPGATPAPTSLLVVQNNEVEGFRVDVQTISLDEDKRTVTFDGIVAAGFNSPVHNAFAGDGIRLIARYDGRTQGRFDQTRIELASGALQSNFGTGVLTVESTPNRPPVAEAGAAIIQSFMTETFLDAFKSYDPDGDELDYKWHVLAGAATLRGCETPTPIFQLVQGHGSYEVRLTVTDSRGASSYDYIRINYVGR